MMFRPKGFFIVERWFKGKLVKRYKFRNTITIDGKNHIFNSTFVDATQITVWYVGLISAASFNNVLAGNTMDSHAGWLECTDYDEATRRAWTPVASTNAIVQSGAATVFTMNVTQTLKGLFITSGSAKNGTAGVLWAAALQNMDAIAGEELRVTYKVEA